MILLGSLHQNHSKQEKDQRAMIVSLEK